MMIPLCRRPREVSEDVGGTVEDQETLVTNLESQKHALDAQAARTPPTPSLSMSKLSVDSTTTNSKHSWPAAAWMVRTRSPLRTWHHGSGCRTSGRVRSLDGCGITGTGVGHLTGYGCRRSLRLSEAGGRMGTRVARSGRRGRSSAWLDFGSLRRPYVPIWAGTWGGWRGFVVVRLDSPIVPDAGLAG